MASPVLMPRQGQSVESCIITEFFYEVGDNLTKGSPLFAYETDKASFEEECPTDGVLLEVFYAIGDEVPVLTNVAVIGEKGESVDEFRPDTGQSQETLVETKEKESEPDTNRVEQAKTTIIAGAAPLGKQAISPRAKRLAEKKRISTVGIIGSGPNGRVIERDVIAALDSQPKMSSLASQLAKEEGLTPGMEASGPAGTYIASDLLSGSMADFEEKPLTNIRKLIAKAMHNSLQNSAQLTHHLSADARKILALRKKSKALVKEGVGPNITLNDLICFAAIRAIKKHLEGNIHFLGDTIRYFNNVHLGLAVDTDRGLMVPAVRNADHLSLTGLSAQMKTIAEACKTGSIDPDLLSSEAATFTISNLGNYGVEMFTPVLNLPQACILGVNTIIQRPAQLEDGGFGFVPFIGLSLTYNHMAIDGGPATKLLAEIKTEIENIDMNIL